MCEIHQRSVDQSSCSSSDHRLIPNRNLPKRTSFLLNKLFEVLPTITFHLMCEVLIDRRTGLPTPSGLMNIVGVFRINRRNLTLGRWRSSQKARLFLLELPCLGRDQPVIYFRCIGTKASAFFPAISRRSVSRADLTMIPEAFSVDIAQLHLARNIARASALAISLSTTFTPQP